MVKKSTKELLGFNDAWVLLLGVPVLAFFIPILFFRASLSEGLVNYIPEFLTSLMFTLGYWITVRSIVIHMRRRFPRHTQVRRRMLYMLTAIFLAYLLIHTALGFFHDRLTPHPERPGVTDFDYAVGSFTIILLVTAIYEGVYLYDRWRTSMIEQEKLRREFVESQLAGLREQVNPHFLFNSLNTLTFLIPEDPMRAVKFVRKLSKVYRYLLEMKDKQLIPLAEELNFLESYTFLLKERFGDNLCIRIDIPDEKKENQVVPLSLQILFENAIKHNIISSDHPLWIEVAMESGSYLTVRNNLQLKHQKMHSTKVGLQNIRNRYAFFCDQEVVIRSDEKHFEVAIPLLEAPVEIA